MAFFRDDEMLNTLSADDRIELFLHALTGNSDFTPELFKSLFSDYGITHLTVQQVPPSSTKQ